jgi:hypothetical protein
MRGTWWIHASNSLSSEAVTILLVVAVDQGKSATLSSHVMNETVVTTRVSPNAVTVIHAMARQRDKNIIL